MRDQRRFGRISFREALGLESGLRDDFQGAIARDLSGGGLRIRSERFLALGAPVRVRLQLNDEILILGGEVVWVQKEPYGEYYQIGVKFEDNSSNMFKRKRIIDFVDTEDMGS